MTESKRPETDEDFQEVVTIAMSADPDTVRMTEEGPAGAVIMDMTTKGLSEYGCPELGVRAPAAWCGSAAFTLNTLGLQSLSEPYKVGHRIISDLGPVPVLFVLIERQEWPGVLWLDVAAVDVPTCAECGEALHNVH
tara:strand:+ start:1479 stop:1889 length:411 start_codon:yes stop_codon:yes gene_type:complete